ncbi:DNase [Raphidocelis subcapitata]|uniref:DNase n=1 Tax=Raphidocelis subcapitata TaxID=307507 RepID=A0A2V0P322_9CHLO|nr:DNase [Raphidocelis subcapitata]|eukprot:GBF91465.1 DNase [Raphidocelis subcapitata]
MRAASALLLAARPRPHSLLCPRPASHQQQQHPGASFAKPSIRALRSLAASLAPAAAHPSTAALTRPPPPLLRRPATGAPAAAAAAAAAAALPPRQRRRAAVAAAAAAMDKPAKPSQGELAAACLVRAPAPIVDIGVNLADECFDKDRGEVLARASEAGVAAIIVTGCSVRSSEAARALCERHAGPGPELFFTAGVHPHSAKECGADTLARLRELAAHEKCVAIGECGLDFNRNFSPQDVQLEWFAKQVDLAIELRKPLFMHCRDAGEAFGRVLRDAAARRAGGAGAGAAAGAAAGSGVAELGVPGVLHCFTGNGEELKDCLALGLSIGITGWVCDDRPERGGAELAALLKTIPRGRLMIETDSPYLVPRTIKPSKARPHRNEPSLLPHVLAAVAAARGESEEAVARQTTLVAGSFFQLPNTVWTPLY